jgi:hypothetical protein
MRAGGSAALYREKVAIDRKLVRNIHALFQAKIPENPH